MSDNQPGRFAGKSVVVTGSSSGIGLTVAEHFGAAGADVVVNSRSAARAAKAAGQVGKTGAKAVAVAADLRTAAGAQQLIDGAVTAFGGVDILVNNAGISMIAPSEELDPADWERAIATNLSGPFFASHAVHPAMKARGGGVIVNIGSVAAHEGLPQRAAYCAAKHGLNGLTKVLAIDWARDNIRVLQIDPAFIKTPLDEEDQVTGGYDDASIERRTPMSRFGGLDEVAAMTLTAAGPESSYMTGSCLAVDGGWMAYGYL
ncbi:MAG TPA: SDR family oxidoreductase [Streptosporangiaceae bacterium]|jgi:3-oxoacyl-[acyl-carrier protein] reductase